MPLEKARVKMTTRVVGNSSKAPAFASSTATSDDSEDGDDERQSGCDDDDGEDDVGLEDENLPEGKCDGPSKMTWEAA